VLVYHVIELTNWTGFPKDGPLVWFRLGFMGVDLFFVISGFVITHMAIAVYGQSRSSFWATFMVNRLCRIVPLYLLTLIVFTVLVIPSILQHPHFLRHALMHLGFVHNFTYDTQGSINGPNWTIATEMQFYVCLAAILPWLIRIRPLYLIGICVAIAWLFRFTMFHIVDDGSLRTFHLFVLTTQLPGCFDLFGFGIALALVMRTKRYETISSTRWFWPSCAFATIAAITMTLKLFWIFPEYWSDPVAVTLFPTLLAVSSCLTVLLACQIKSTTALRILSPLQYLGTISYGIYLWHLTIIMILKGSQSATPFEVLLSTLAGTFFLSSLSWHLLEAPIVSIGKALSLGIRLGRIRNPVDDVHKLSPSPHYTADRSDRAQYTGEGTFG